MWRALAVLAVVGCVFAYEDFAPRASGFHKQAASIKVHGENIRRSPPVYKASQSDHPRAHALTRTSSGVRRAPETVSPSVRSAPAAPAPQRLPPGAIPIGALPLPPAIPGFEGLQNLMGIPVRPAPPGTAPAPARAGEPMVVPSMPMMDMSQMTFPTLPPHTFPTLAPGMPTLPSLTMPPSFQKLMGITTPKPKKEHRRKQQSEEEEEEEEEQPKRRRQGAESSRLSSVRSRLPQFVRDKDDSRPQDNADWIVPF